MNVTLTVIIVLLEEIRLSKADTVVTHVNVAVPHGVSHGLTVRVTTEHDKDTVDLTLFCLCVLDVDRHEEYAELVGLVLSQVTASVNVSVPLESGVVYTRGNI